MLGHAADRYGGVIVDDATLPDTVDAFAAQLEASLKAWIAAGVRGVWLKIPKERAEYVASPLTPADSDSTTPSPRT